MAKSKFFEQIKSSVIEREVEDVYNKGLNLYFPNVDITHDFSCDGLITTKTQNGKRLNMIIEYKFNEILTNKVSRAKVLVQVIFYLKRFEQNGMILPNVCMVGDKNECFVMHTNALLKYLDEDVNWKVAPSNAHEKCPDLVLKIANDGSINPFVFNIDNNFSFKDVVDKIHMLADNVQRFVRVTEHNIATIFDYFSRNVIKNHKKISAHDLVGVFIGTITDHDNYYQHPTKKNILVTPLVNVNINGDGFKSFFSYFQRTYTPQEKNKFAEIADRLIEDTNRRNSGDFWTPTPWVDYAHKMISEQLGDNWKDEYVVWDNCCGSKNLTRDYKFKELYCSTLFESELEIGKRYNLEATSFQFDFLNDSEDKLPAGLLEAFKQNKKIVFLLNPPYLTTSSLNNGEQGKTSSLVNNMMKIDNIGQASQDLYNQFIYRLVKIIQNYNLTNANICVFCKSLYMANKSCKKFRNWFLKTIHIKNGFYFQANNFANVSGNWGISFTIWGCDEQLNKSEFPHQITKFNNDGIIESVSTKILYNADNDGLFIDNIYDKPKRNIVYPNWRKVNIPYNSDIKISDGYICDLYTSLNSIGLSTLVYYHAHDYCVTYDNFKNMILYYATFDNMDWNWITNQNPIIEPNRNHPAFSEYLNDSIVYSLFSGHSFQTSLRQVEYHDKLWDIKNEFFWMSKSEMESLANEHNLDAIYNDARTSNERFVYEKLQTLTLSPEAQAVLDKANELVRSSFKYREMFSEEHPEYQLDKCWDAGWYQIKALLKEYMKDELKEFKILYKALADKMRPQVYELGFLKK